MLLFCFVLWWTTATVSPFTHDFPSKAWGLHHRLDTFPTHFTHDTIQDLEEFLAHSAHLMPQAWEPSTGPPYRLVVATDRSAVFLGGFRAGMDVAAYPALRYTLDSAGVLERHYEEALSEWEHETTYWERFDSLVRGGAWNEVPTQTIEGPPTVYEQAHTECKVVWRVSLSPNQQLVSLIEGDPILEHLVLEDRDRQTVYVRKRLVWHPTLCWTLYLHDAEGLDHRLLVLREGIGSPAAVYFWDVR